ncbi:hypothetical protein CAEBREN_12004 [Caenorhabditis brenneri]|uniref:T20D4.11-like domain-containing protein n=1 Tax=Caenorhabditis brenneri TaxID=135651 RepID=G0NF11_CAEBE|nr:hypothetical protein CAEBREN_12004 [Caenorhabditis brenneri]
MKIEETCEFINYLETENQSCLKGFFKTIYNLPLTGNVSCYGDYPFVDKDLKNREKAYKDGEKCFMGYIQNNCNNTTLQYFNSENYKKFIRSASSDPSEFDCEDPVHGVEMIRCSTASAELDRFKTMSDDIENRLNRTFVTTILRTCRDVVSCGTNRCLFYKSDCERIELSKKCDMIEKEYL